jgi:hypothetical protein
MTPGSCGDDEQFEYESEAGSKDGLEGVVHASIADVQLAVAVVAGLIGWESFDLERRAQTLLPHCCVHNLI